jgi:radical SAM protein (TIGR04043 family)
MSAQLGNTGADVSTELADLIADLQSRGMRVDSQIGGKNGGRNGGAGPSDAGMLWIEGVGVTVPTNADFVASSPYAMRPEDEGWGVYEGNTRLAGVAMAPRPKYYDLTTADGIPYWKIAVMHLDSMASTVLQTCTYWGHSDQCKFCGIGVSLAAGRTIAKKTPAMLAEVAVAARDLDGAVDSTLTTGSTKTPDRGALYIGKCAEAVKNASGLPVQVQFEPPANLDSIDQVHDLGADSLGIHIETFDPNVLARVAPGKARWGIDAYFAAWERGVKAFGEGQVSTYVILGMGEDPKITIEGCKRAIDIGVYPFIVPLRPVPGSLMADVKPPSPEYVESIYNAVVPYLNHKKLSIAMAGCVRCGACSGMGALARALAEPAEGKADGRRSLPIIA